MTDFVERTIDDITHGRQSWRVIATLSFVSFAVSVALPFLR